MDVLVVNAGSSTVKLSVVDGEDRSLGAVTLELPDGRYDEARLIGCLDALPPAGAVGHRVVHGGTATSAERIDDAARSRVAALAELAPLHQARALAGIDAVARARPDLPAVACYDTAFHASLPAAAATYALPRAWSERYGLRRVGFHGLSHAGVARRAGAGARLVSCHLGAGASVAAIRGGRSVDTTMGFTPLEGLVMATRSGSVDPGLLLWLARTGRVTLEDLDRGLEHESGLLGLAGTADMREVLARDDDAARLALDVYVHRLCAAIAAMAAALGGLDVLAFTGGVGEHAAPVRLEVARRLSFLGVAVDPDANAAAGGDADVSAAGARARTLVVTAREDVEIARQTRAALAG